MVPARFALKTFVAFSFVLAALVVPRTTLAATGGPQQCVTGGSCTLGEFLYDDNYVPISTATCTITSRDPSGNIYINNASMTSASDGWYSYQISSTPSTTGMYRSQVCCRTISLTFTPSDVNTTTDTIVVGRDISTATSIRFSSSGTLPTGLVADTDYFAINVNSTSIKVAATASDAQVGVAIDLTSVGTGTHTLESNDLMCLDKSFEVVDLSSSLTTSSIATAVWGYSGRTLTGFGSLVSDIWNNSSRTLTSFGSIVTDIWNNNSRTLTQTSTQDTDLAEIKKTVKENRLLLEQLVNKPIIESFLEEEETPDLNAKLNDSKTIAIQLYANYQYVLSKAQSLLTKWDGLSDDQLLESVNELSGVLGEESDSNSTNSIFGQVNWMKNSWDWSVASQLHERTKAVKGSLSSIQTQLGSRGKTRYGRIEMKSLVGYLTALEKILGDSSDESGSPTIFGKLAEVSELAKVFDERLTESDEILANWGDGKDKKLINKVATLFKRVLAVNKIPNMNSVISSGDDENYSAEKNLKNKVLGLRGIINSNIKLLARVAGKPLSNTWAQEGSIVFKSLVTNPSELISQEVPLKYYLPPEVKKENILETSDGLTVEHDAEKDQYYVSGTFTLGPSETLTLTVKVEDIWVIDDETIESLRRQAAELAKPLDGTSFFAQGVTLTSDINVSLDKVVALKKDGVTPEAKIRAYREAEIELNSVEEKMASLQELVTQAGSTATLFGFVGGAQTLAVWGLIIIMVTGFVSLVVYMRSLGVKSHRSKEKPKDEEGSGPKEGVIKGPMINQKRKGFRYALHLVVVAIISAALTAGITSLILGRSSSQKGENIIPPERSEKDVPNTSVLPASDESIGGVEIVRLESEDSSPVKVYSEADDASPVIFSFNTPYEVIRLVESEGWVKIAFSKVGSFDQLSEGWVEAKYVVSRDTFKDSSEEKHVEILETPTGWLRVRATPDGEEISKVNPGETYKLLNENSAWYQIELEDGAGWISSKYASVIEKSE